MSLTPEQIKRIRIKMAETPDALKRNPFNDYIEGWFHVTLNTKDDAPVLGYIEGNAEAADGSGNEPRCVLTDLGRKVEETWRDVSRRNPLCMCDEIQVMPEHLHVLLHLMPGNRVHLGRIINGLMIGCTHAYWDTLGIPWREMRNQINDMVKRFAAENNADAAFVKALDKVLRAQWQDSKHSRSYRGPSLMRRGYNDVEAVTEDEVDIKRRYIRNNPRKRLVSRSRPDCFCVVRNSHSENWTLEKALSAVAADPWIRRDVQTCQRLQANVAMRLKRQPDNDNILAIDYVGNRSLLSAGRKVSLICHRADSAMFNMQKAAVLRAAREGAVVVSAFVSPKERDIMKLLMQERLPFIELSDNGFGERYKPGGKAFYSTAEKRHVQMSCWTYVYRSESYGNDDSNENRPVISREMCLVMNEMVRIISGEKDDWWK